jgi:peptidoglycan/xylan/chitin deacetylase (PgdA/CDA1 family)
MNDLSEWYVDAGAKSVDDSTAYVGSRSMRLEATGGGDISINKDFSSIDLSDRVPVFAFKTDSAEDISIEVRVNAPGASDRRVYGNQSFSMRSPTGWTLLSLGFSRVDGSPDLSNLGTIVLRVNNVGSGAITVWIGGLFAVQRPDRGYVVMNWDDGNRSRYSKAFQDMREFGYPGVSSMPTAQVGTASRLTIDQMVEMRDELGWEFISHTHNNVNVFDLTERELRAEFANSRAWLRGENDQQESFATGADHIIFPFVNFDRRILDIAKEYFRTAGSNTGNHLHGMQVHGFDPMAINRVEGNDRTELTKLLERTATERQAAVINFHNFGASNTLSRNEFRSFLTELHDNYTRTGDIEVITMSRLYDIRRGSA